MDNQAGRTVVSITSMYKQKLFAVLIVCLAVAACKSGNNRPYDYGYGGGGYSFTSFNLVDTYGVDSRYSSSPQVIDPFNTDGGFEAFWAIRTDQNYEARLFVNTVQSNSGRRVFGYAFCGGSDVRICYKSDGTFYCDMNQAGTLSCDDAGGSTNLSDWLINTNRFYLGLEICSTQGYGCTTKYREVTIY
jgi:hypothetical protein